MTTYPDDDDGAVLSALASEGVDMSQPLQIEFAVAAEDEASAMAIGDALTQAGYDAQIEYDEGELDEEDDPELDAEEFGLCWTVYANVTMVPEYAELVRIQAELDVLARKNGGKADGWGVVLGGQGAGSLD